MNGAAASAALAVLLGWTGFALAGWLAPAPAPAPEAVAAGLGAAGGVAAVLLFRDTLALNGLVALLAPFGVMLPALALRHAAASLGLPVMPFATWELLAFFAVYILFLSSVFGLVPLEFYRLGYAPLPVAAMVLAVCAYGGLTGNLFLPMVAVAGQLFWVAGWGSSNWFDHFLHVLLVPVMALELAGRLF